VPHRLAVVVPTPAHSGISEPLSYLSELPLPAGTLVRVPLGRREVLGVVWDATSDEDPVRTDFEARPISAELAGLPPLSGAWINLVTFCARYYRRGLGEVALAGLPPQLRDMDVAQLARRLKRPRADAAPSERAAPLVLTAEQREALAGIESASGPFLLFGATGSGKTEVYLQAVQNLLARDANAQALVMVPEINLTPQLQERFVARFGAANVVAMNSGMTNPQRLKSWLAAHMGAARIVLGTRMAVFASMPQLKLVIVDEEHHPSYKQQAGARYSARDLAVYRARLEGA
jgi:primosomal protein N' (replication factor Y)